MDWLCDEFIQLISTNLHDFSSQHTQQSELLIA